MNLGKVGVPVKEDFTVVDGLNNLVTGIDSTSFIIHIYNPNDSEVSSTLSPEIVELGSGNYRLKFIPDITGVWYIQVIHSTYFPWGKENTVQVFNNNIDDISTHLDTMTDLIIRTLGLTQENFYIDNTSYDPDHGMMTGSRIRIYSNASSVETDSNVIATYVMSASYDDDGQMQTYSVKLQ